MSSSDWIKLLGNVAQPFDLRSLGGEVQICVDGEALGRIVSEGIEWIYGGQWLELRERVEAFVSQMQKHGITCVVFFHSVPCPTPADDLAMRAAVASRFRLAKRAAALAAQGSEIDVQSIPTEIDVAVAQALTLAGVKVLSTTSDNHTREIAYWCNQNKCKGVLADDPV